ncbi:Tectonic-1 Precursor [Takifugu flavidus]|uniref:Tectonic-1 n=1 Tax=Takifugu flavidus TaxID=433684 RepID=A0A5C6MR86_9TELE|nr:Tectonic-1 Precursor [Takifugu flavidus]
MSNVTLFGDSNVTTNGTDDYAEPASTTPPPDYSSTLQPSLSSGPLPLSARLPAPATNVADICPCDEQRDVCDSNCCCDTACGDHVALFTGCSVTSVGGNKQLCSREVASYSLASTIDGYSTLQSSVQRESHTGVFCIQSQNGVDGLSHPSPALPTDDNFDSLFQQSTRFIFSSEENGGQVSTAEDPAFSGYRYGDVLGTREESGERGRLWLPAPSVSARCVDTNPAAFLMDQSSRCTRPVVLESDCSTLPTLNMDSYTSIQVLAVVPMEISSVILQSVEGTQTQLMMTAGKDLRPVLLNPSLCANVVLKVAYLMKYTPAGEIVSVALSLVIGFVHETALPLQQEFQIAFVQDPHQRSPILFGVDFVSGCSLRMEEVANCSLVSQTMLSVLRGSNYPQYVASFGNSPLENPFDWLPVMSNFNPGAQLVSIKEVIQTNKSSLASLSGGSNILPITSSVSFVAVGAAASPGYRAMPTINAKLPADFFFPFV